MGEVVVVHWWTIHLECCFLVPFDCKIDLVASLRLCRKRCIVCSGLQFRFRYRLRLKFSFLAMFR